ncbi:YgiT-type zinc finger domain protein [Archaeoglobus fulgidus DSM 8774]|uniref:YgiT-type zinc finger domain protein n=1 Tax=Archaeoglobus fulgidus DSM 8774 TaxID=1344584 RepID=A0A075WF17_ARCFL|nr:type II toxin-antitoxin system MqsA family antitoxin [Archaeoglobus fulgidus]AIG98387.1 YgiT-type zinc finger domain protein [Archaeoglobus fulgidus DSM 8774]
MKPDKCDLCNGKLHEGKTEFVARVGDKVVVIKGIPAYICEECGEAYFTPEISRKIDKIMREFHEGKLLMRPIDAGEIELEI